MIHCKTLHNACTDSVYQALTLTGYEASIVFTYCPVEGEGVRRMRIGPCTLCCQHEYWTICAQQNTHNDFQH